MYGLLINADVNNVVTSSVAVTNEFSTTYLTSFFSYALTGIVGLVLLSFIFTRLLRHN